MKFNSFVWELYKKSERGKKAMREYSRLTEQFISEWCRELPVELSEDNDAVSIKSVDFFKAGMKGKFTSLEKANKHFTDVLVPKGISWKCDGEDEATYIEPSAEEWYDYVAAFSLGFHLSQPEWFLPYNFRGEFNHVKEIHEEFGIPLPHVPSKRNKEARGFYYILINQVWQEFRLLHGLSPVEMCAFLYDFAPEFTISEDVEDLPDPSRVWFVPCGLENFDRVDKASAKKPFPWSGNPDVRRGDILVMYKFKPLSRIDSVWRACSDGFFDPFYGFSGRVILCGRIKTQPVTLDDLRNDPWLGKKSAVKLNFQWENSSAPITVEEYAAILKIMEGKGQDISLLPQIEVSNYSPPGQLLTERDVEEDLIEPFLKRLEFKASDWVRQMPVKMGRGERNYPDYAFGANPRRGEESAKMILESKFQLSAQSDLKEAFYQTKSYALRLQSKIMAMAAREGVWVFPPDNGNFDIKKFVHKSWGELNHPDHFHVILQLIGRDKVMGKM